MRLPFSFLEHNLAREVPSESDRMIVNIGS